MPRYSLKAVLRGITAASIGFGMLAVAFQEVIPPEISFGQAFLVAFGGALAGYGLAFPFQWPPHQMVLAMVGMFAAQAWQTGSSFGLIIYICLMALFGVVRVTQNLRARRDSRQNNFPSAQS